MPPRPLMQLLLSRREFGALFLALVVAPSHAADAQRQLDVQVDLDGFGDVNAADVRAVTLSAAGEIWKHCPNTRFEEPGFKIYHRKDVPITDYEHVPDGRIAIGLASEGRTWARMAFQFAHEFCHALAGHSNNWKSLVRNSGANMWFEESLCETASLFSLRAMGVAWQTAPPYPNWRDYARHLTSYAQDRIDAPEHQLPSGLIFQAWFRQHHLEMRKSPTLRNQNTIVAKQLLPIFEKQPEGWEAVAALNLGDPDPAKSFAQQLTEWQKNVRSELRQFVASIGAIFDQA